VCLFVLLKSARLTTRVFWHPFLYYRISYFQNITPIYIPFMNLWFKLVCFRYVIHIKFSHVIKIKAGSPGHFQILMLHEPQIDLMNFQNKTSEFSMIYFYEFGYYFCTTVHKNCSIVLVHDISVKSMCTMCTCTHWFLSVHSYTT
jgi:hypothetical protein